MKKTFRYITTFLCVASLASCTIVYPGLATNNTMTKTGIAERKVFMSFAFGHTDLGIATAAKKGNITKIATVDYAIKHGLFSTTYRVIVTGE